MQWFFAFKVQNGQTLVVSLFDNPESGNKTFRELSSKDASRKLFYDRQH